MQYPSLRAYLLAKPGVNTNFQPDWRWHRFYVADKMFAALCMADDDSLWCVTVKLPPEEGELLRAQHGEIKPGYYMNKLHWNTVWAEAPVPDDLLLTMLDHAWETALRSLSQKKQREIRQSMTD